MHPAGGHHGKPRKGQAEGEREGETVGYRRGEEERASFAWFMGENRRGQERNKRVGEGQRVGTGNVAKRRHLMESEGGSTGKGQRRMPTPTPTKVAGVQGIGRDEGGHECVRGELRET